MAKKRRRQNSPERIEMLANRYAEQRARVGGGRRVAPISRRPKRRY